MFISDVHEGQWLETEREDVLFHCVLCAATTQGQLVCGYSNRGWKVWLLNWVIDTNKQAAICSSLYQNSKLYSTANVSKSDHYPQ